MDQLNEPKIPTFRVGIVVAHGIGFQKPYDTLQNVLEGVDWTVKKRASEGHLIEELPVTYGKLEVNGGVCHDYASRPFLLTLSEGVKIHLTFDVYEYYWGDAREFGISSGQAFGWFTQLVKELNDQREQDGENIILLRRKGVAEGGQDRASLNKCCYRLVDSHHPSANNADYVQIVWILRRFAWLLPMLRLGNTLSQGVLTRGLEFVLRLARGSLRINWMDLVMYLNRQPDNPFRRKREGIIKGLEELSLGVLANEDRNYQSVVFAGHSLGSVILFDALNQMNTDSAKRLTQAQRERLHTIVTFGSPLGIVTRLLFFSLEKTTRYKNQLMLLNHGLRVVPDRFLQDYNFGSREELKALFDELDVAWFNFFSDADPISTELEPSFTQVTDVHRDYRDQENAHGAYWSDHAIYERLFDRLWEDRVSPMLRQTKETMAPVS
ncbi:MAG: hypothetical protein ACFB6S_09490 [Geminicoccaceae bacterium]